MNVTDLLRGLLTTFSSNPLLARLFFASVEFAVLAALVYGAIRLGRIRLPRLIAVLWLMVLAKPIVSLAIGSPLPLVRMDVPAAVDVSQTAMDVAEPEHVSTPSMPFVADDAQHYREPGGHEDLAAVAVSATASPIASLPTDVVVVPVAMQSANSPLSWNLSTIVLAAWITGVVLFAVLSLLDRFRVRRLVRRSRAPDFRLADRYHGVVMQLGLKKPVSLQVTDALEGPALIGSIAPTILMPAWLAGDADSAKIDWALRHELMHWKLRDPLASLVRELAQILFYFHPVAWWAGREWEIWTERACDRAIINDETDSRDYAEQLYGILLGMRGRVRISVKSGLFATRTQIGQRIATLLNGPRTAPHLSTLAIVGVALLTAGTLCVGGAFAEKQDTTPSPNNTVIAEEAKAAPMAESGPGPSVSPTAAPAGVRVLPAKEENGGMLTVRGQVLAPNGRPVTRASVAVFRWQTLPIAVGKSDDNGRFELSYRKSQFGEPPSDDRYAPWKYVTIAAQARGFGVQWTNWEQIEPSKPLELKLVPDLPIRGRVVDSEGKPVGGVQVHVTYVSAMAKGTRLDPWLEAIKSEKAPSEGLPLLVPFGEGKSHPTTTDADGHFTISGIGAERVARLRLRGETITLDDLTVATRKMEPLSGVTNPWRSPIRVFGTEFTYTARPIQPVVGTVRDAATGKPLANVGVESRWGNVIQTKTDVDGHYRLVGLPKPDYSARRVSSALKVLPNAEQPYLVRDITVPYAPEKASVTLDIDLHRGIWIEGRVTDKKTGKPVDSAQVTYWPLLSNPFTHKLPEFSRGLMDYPNFPGYSTRPDGRYRLPGLPGPAIVGVSHWGKGDFYYLHGVGASEIKAIDKDGYIPTYRNPTTATSRGQNALKEINPAPGAESFKCDFVLDPGETVRLALVDRDGKPVPLADCSINGDLLGRQERDRHGSTVELAHLAPNETRVLTIVCGKRNVGKVLRFKFDAKAPRDATVTLERCATVVGRLTDKDGVPLKGIELFARWHPYIGRPLRFPPVVNRPDGKFALTGLIPGPDYALDASGPEIEWQTAADNIKIEPGKTIDLGDVKLKRRK